MEWIILVSSIVLFCIVVVFRIFFKVSDIHIAVMSSFFTGRLKRKPDDDGYSIPIAKPKKEGFHIKWPWESYTLVSTSPEDLVIKNMEFPVDGGKVIVSVTIQFRVSFLAAYRFLEVENSTIKEGLRSEFEQMLRLTLGTLTVEEAIKPRQSVDLSANLFNRFTTTDLRTTEELRNLLKDRDSTIQNILGKLGDDDQKTRKLFGEKISYAEHSYGIEILKAKVDQVDPDPELEESRKEIQKEEYERISQKTEFEHLIDMMSKLKAELPKLPDDKRAEFIQVWQGLSQKDIRKLEVEGGTALDGSLAGFLSGITKSKE